MKPEENTAEQLIDTLILVDEADNEIGTAEKINCHLGQGQLHRAFSVFLFNPAGELLIQQRSANKMLWPTFWANSCCSHPRAGETTAAAAQRRIQEELGVSAELHFLYKFVYQAAFKDIGSEYENCSVFIGKFDGVVNINHEEIADYRFIEPAELSDAMATEPEIYSPWFKLEWERIQQEFQHELPQADL